ncbi:hypothetical protein PITC_095700 [Penicillium italicum]|uniref:Zn(2)-C6 fungal-type domain-containing protein n=1 Tax=Penicillium italicum TaxID=40296 RepID=A0A0A2KQM2_PENIT|nr:hypothetical protein PITC_095700 [Penicillium italicum]
MSPPSCVLTKVPRDVLRRHWKSCKARVDSGYGIPDPEHGGKHKRACDSCANLRKACNGGTPCTECTQRERQCTYQRLLGDQLSLPSASQTLIETPDVESSCANDNAPEVSESDWELGPATLYPPHRKIIARRQKFPFG